MMSLYEGTADGLDLMKGYVAIDAASLPITSDELNGLRQRLGLGLPTDKKQNVDVYPGNPDLLFTQGVAKNFPNWKPVLDEMRKNSLTQFEGKYPDFFVDLRKALNKEGDDSNANVLFYLDFYNQAVANGQYHALTGDLATQEKEYFKALFPQKESYTRVLANAYLKHIVNVMNLKKQDLADGDLKDKRIHELKASLDFGSKLTVLTILNALGQEVDDYGFTYGDTLEFLLVKSGDQFAVKSIHNGKPLDFTSKSKGGELALDDWNEYIIDRMYFGNIGDLDSENPDNHLTRETADSEDAMQWWANQKKYEDRVFLKDTADTTPLPLQTIDKSATDDDEDSNTSSSSTDDEGPSKAPSSSEVTFGTTNEDEASTAIATETNFGSSEDIAPDKSIQFNTLDKVGKFERTQGEDISLAHGEQVSLGLDNVVVRDGISTNLYKDLSFPTSASKTEAVAFSSAHILKLDGTEDTQTSPQGKALQLNHYVPVEVDRLKAQVTQDNVVSLLGAGGVPDNHVYTEKVRQNTLRGITVMQGEHYKVDLSAVDPENAAVTRTATGDDSIHVEGSSKTREAGPEDEKDEGSGFIRLNTEPTEEESDADKDGDKSENADNNYSTAGSGSSFIAGQMAPKPASSRTGFLKIGGD